jgi:hypothetical protein
MEAMLSMVSQKSKSVGKSVMTFDDPRQNQNGCKASLHKGSMTSDESRRFVQKQCFTFSKALLSTTQPPHQLKRVQISRNAAGRQRF